MARKKSNGGQEGAGDDAPDETGAEAGPSISKAEALREALRELGTDAKNSDLEGYIRDKYGEQAVPANFSVAKSAAMKKLRAAEGEGKPQGEMGGTRAAKATSSSSEGGISLEDLRQIKDLAARYGKDQVTEILDLLG